MTSDEDLADYLDALSPRRRQDAETLLAIMRRVTGQPPVVDRGAVGFGTYHYKYASGREGDAPAAAFAMRKAAISVYFMDGLGPYADRLARLGPHKAAVGCLYLKSLAEIDLEVLESMIAESYATLTAGTYRHRARESESGRPD